MEWSGMLTDSGRLGAIRDYTDRRISQVLEDLAREIGLSPLARNAHALHTAHTSIVEITAYWAAVHPDRGTDVGPCGLSPIPEADWVLGVARAQEVYERIQRDGDPLPPSLLGHLETLLNIDPPDTESGYYASLALEKLADAVRSYHP